MFLIRNMFFCFKIYMVYYFRYFFVVEFVDEFDDRNWFYSIKVVINYLVMWFGSVRRQM